jgi:hypothetical protein
MFQRLVANARGDVSAYRRIGVSAYRRIGVLAYWRIGVWLLGSGIWLTKFLSHLFGFVADIPWNGRI